LKLFSVTSGLAVPIATLYALSMFQFGSYALSDEASCYAVEFPNNEQYGANPIDTDQANFIGLRVVNVTSRFQIAILSGMIIESCILLTVLLGLCCGRFTKLGAMWGYTSLGWFVWLLFVRYDHYGKVCSGDFLDADDTLGTLYPNLNYASYAMKGYFGAVGLVVSALFLIVLMYSCCVDASKKSTEKESDEDM
jgi:hypothetical protein